MEIYNTANMTKFQQLVAKVQDRIVEWKAVDIIFDGDAPIDMTYVTKQLESYFGAWDGALFVCSKHEVLALVHIGEQVEIDSVKDGVVKRLPGNKCKVSAGGFTREGLKTIEIRIRSIEQKKSEPTDAQLSLQKKRAERNEKLFLVIDDDYFIRSQLAKSIGNHGKVIELSDGSDALKTYEAESPDAVFLDIHLPSGSGLALLEKILEFDSAAKVIIVSSDGMKENVLTAQTTGAWGFLAKQSMTKEKVDALIKKLLLEK